MAAADGYIRIDTKLNTSGVESGLSKLKGSLGSLAGAVGLAFGVKEVIQFGQTCIQSAADVKAAGSQFEQTFRGIQDQAQAAMDRVADSSGILETRLKSVGTGIYAFAKTTGMDSANALSLMERALKVTADSAAYYDKSLEETAENLQSFLKGNYENDAALGLACTEVTRNTAANQLYGKSFNDLSEAQKQLTLLQMVEDANALSGALGQAARESDGWENVTGNLSESLRQLMAVLGEPFLQAAVPAVQGLTRWMQQLADMVRSGYDAIAQWASTVDFGPLMESAGGLKDAFSDLFSNSGEAFQILWRFLEPAVKWLIQTALPKALNFMSGLLNIINTIWDAVSPVINRIGDAIDWVFDKIKKLVVAVSNFFGLEPPAWAAESSEDDSFEDAKEDVDDLTDSYEDLEDAAGDAGDAMEDATDAGDDGGGSGGSGSSAKRDVLGFDQITKLSEQSGSSGGGSGGGGSGGSSGGGSGGGSEGSPGEDAADTNIKQWEDAAGDAIDDLRIKFDDLNITIDTTSRKLNDLAKDRDADITIRLKKDPNFDSLKAQWDSIRDSKALKELRLAKEDYFDDLKAQWDAIRSGKALKELRLTLEQAVQAAIQVTVERTIVDTEQDTDPGRGGGFGSGHGGGFSDPGRGGGFGGGNGGGFSDASSLLEDLSDSIQNALRKLQDAFSAGPGGVFTGPGWAILETVEDWWKGLKKGKATKTLDLKAGSFGGGGGGFTKGVKQWESIKDGKATKTLEGKTTTKYTRYQRDWQDWISGTITKTSDGKQTGKYTSYQKNWLSWVSGTITKTSDGKQTGNYTSYQRDWRSWVSGTITKTSDGRQTGSYTSYHRDWRNWISGTITKKADSSRTSRYSSYRSDWTGWKSQTVTKTAEAARGRYFSSIKRDWDSMKNKTVTGTISLKATVSNIKTWINRNVITPLNRAIHVVLPSVSIPKLATGGLVNRATMALIGEAGREAVLPLDRNTGWMDELAGRIAQQVGGPGGQMIVEVHVGNDLLTRQVVQDINEETERTGRCPIYL